MKGVNEYLRTIFSIIPCISTGAERDSLAAFPSLLGLDSYDMQTKIVSTDVNQHIPN